MANWRHIASLALALGLAAAAAPALANPTLTLSPCPLPDTAEMGRCGVLDVPEDRSRPNGRTISLKVMVLPALDGQGKAAPLFDLAGGPGEPASISAGFYAVDGKAWRADRDVVLVDVRGTGESNPLRCPALKPPTPLARLYPPEDVRACRAAVSASADLRQYTTRATAQDMDAVRAALGYDRIDIVALSYGTMLAQTYMRLYPQRVRAAVLVGSVPLGERLPLHHAANAEKVLQLLLADCAAAPACHAAYPALAADWASLRGRFAAGPIRMTGVGGAPILVDAGPFMEALRALMTTSYGQARVPLVITRAAQGDISPLLKPGGPGVVAEGLYLSVACAEGTNWITDGEIDPATASTFAGRYRVDEQRAACREWRVGRVSGRNLPPPSPDTPVLFLAGGRDQTTPAVWAGLIAMDYPNSRVVVIPPMAHGIDGVEGVECFDSLALAFYAAGSAKDLDRSCLATMKPPPFVTAAP